MRTNATVGGILAGVFAQAALIAPASAHDPPQGTGLWWLPSGAGSVDSREHMIIRTNRGLIVENDDGSAFDFLCNEVMGVASTEEAPLAVAAGGAVFVATYANGLRSGTPDLCQWQSPAGGAASLPTFDVATDPRAPSTLYLLAGKSDTTTNFFVSPDLASSWSALASSDIPYTRVRVAPSNPLRIYRTGAGLGADSQLVHRLSVSDDGGVTANQYQIPLVRGELQARLLGIDPTNPERIFVQVEATSIELPERLIVSDDGGRTFATVLTLHGFKGFAISPDGNTLWAGGTEGLWRSTDRGEHFDRVVNSSVTRVGCLAFHANQLFVCGVTRDEFNVSVSSDQGESFRKVVSFSEVGQIIACSDDSAVASVCEGPMAHWRSEVASFIAGAGVVSAGGAGGVGGSTAPGTGIPGPGTATKESAPGCNIGPAAHTDNPLPVLLIAGVLWVRRRLRSIR